MLLFPFAVVRRCFLLLVSVVVFFNCLWFCCPFFVMLLYHVCPVLYCGVLYGVGCVRCFFGVFLLLVYFVVLCRGLLLSSVVRLYCCCILMCYVAVSFCCFASLTPAVVLACWFIW